MKKLSNILLSLRRIILFFLIIVFLILNTFYFLNKYENKSNSKICNGNLKEEEISDSICFLNKYSIVSNDQKNHSSYPKTIVKKNSGKKIDYIIHKPITITSEEDFVNLGCPGSGTEDDPYIIENYNISTGDTEYLEGSCGILIRYVSSFVIIRNCFIQGYGVGISSETRAGGVIVENCTLLYNQYGVLVHQSGDSLIKNNYFWYFSF